MIEIEYLVKNDINNLFGFSIVNQSKKILSNVIEYEQIDFKLNINIMFVSNQKIRSINKRYRNINKSTDVLSFPVISYDKPSNLKKYVKENNFLFADKNFLKEGIFIGDIIISVDKVIYQSKIYEHSIKREYSFLLVHAILHLLGYDHIKKQDEIIMFKKQKDILHKLGI